MHTASYCSYAEITIILLDLNIYRSIWGEKMGEIIVNHLSLNLYLLEVKDLVEGIGSSTNNP
tara:strand:- start:605 stop:790 length:186 start_codon:yes stop_codon:yes gene_type:complete